jgi:hypothetical protein
MVWKLARKYRRHELDIAEIIERASLVLRYLAMSLAVVLLEPCASLS